MTVLLYGYYDLEERVSKKTKIWKGFHILLFIIIFVFGILNYTFLLSARLMVDDHCVLYPKELRFHMVELPLAATDLHPINESKAVLIPREELRSPTPTITVIGRPSDDEGNITKREIQNEAVDTEITIEVNNVTFAIGNRTHRLMLDTIATWFAKDNDCQFAEYMPIMSSIFAVVWLTLFVMCPAGGRVRSGLQQPWRILTPAFLFALVMVFVTGFSFTQTNGGLHAFCAEFYNYTETTACSAVNKFLVQSWYTDWGFGMRAAAARAAAAAVWAGWACAAALLLARCMAAPDFQIKRTDIYLRDPKKKIIPYMAASPNSSSMRDSASVKSDPTLTSQLVTASMERGEESIPASLLATPVKKVNFDVESLELSTSPSELHFKSGR